MNEVSALDINREKAKAYQRIKIQLSLLNMALELVGLVVLLVCGLCLWLRQWVCSWSDSPSLQVLLFFLILGTVGELLTFPLDWYRGWRLEQRFDLSNQTLRAWFWDWCKAFVLQGVIGLVLIELIYFLLRVAGADWWWIAALFMVGFMVVLAQLAPVILLPIFYKVKPLDRPDLKERLIRLAEKCGARVVDVFELEISAKSKTANAALAGLGRTRRILLGDTLLSDYSDEEIEGVLAHELGHHAHGHLWKNIVIQTGVIFLGFFIADRLLGWGVGIFGFGGVEDLAAFPLLALSFSLLALLLLPLINGLSRLFERQADRFAAQVIGKPEPLVTALQRLCAQNLADPEPHPVVEFFLYSHPSIGRRVRALGGDSA